MPWFALIVGLLVVAGWCFVGAWLRHDADREASLREIARARRRFSMRSAVLPAGKVVWRDAKQSGRDARAPLGH